jgi:hypothetical protein
LEINGLREFERLVEQGLNKEGERIVNNKRDLRIEQFESEHDFDIYLDMLNDDLVQTAEINDMMKFLMVVKLNIIVEITIKRILLWTLNNPSEADRNNLFKEMSYHNKMRDKMNNMNIRLEDINEFLTIDEIRCLNNAIKHGGLVDAELSRFNLWSNDKEKEIDANKIILETYYEAIPNYIYDFTDKVKDYLSSIKSII